jgi:CRISPR/Cas system endoribonuclease Cas6 (RAMP superfamily)
MKMYINIYNIPAPAEEGGLAWVGETPPRLTNKVTIIYCVKKVFTINRDTQIFFFIYHNGRGD